MWWRLLAKSLLHRRSRMAVMVAALLLGSALVSAFLVLGSGVQQKAAGELSAYGPNLLLLPQGFDLAVTLGGLEMGSVARSGRLSRESLSALASAAGVEGFAPFLYGIAEVSGRPVVVAGTSLSALPSLFPGWRWRGEPDDPEAAYLGAELARRLGLAAEDSIVLRTREGEHQLRVGGVVEVGGSEDRQLLMELGSAGQMLGEEGVDLVFLRARGSGRELARAAEAVAGLVPGSQARVLSQVAGAEAQVLSRIRYLMGLVTVLVLLAAALAVLSTMTFLVWERQREVGLMKALGAREGQVAFQFLAEAWGVALLSGLPGSLLGVALARWIALRVFASPAALPPQALPLTWLIVLGVTTLAAYLPVRRAAGIAPAVVLKGE